MFRPPELCPEECIHEVSVSQDVLKAILCEQFP